MQIFGSLSSGLAALPAWLNAGRTLEMLFADWVRASGYRTAGLVWPCGDAPTLVRFADASGQVTGVGPVPPESGQMLALLTDGPPTAVWAVPQSSGRLYTRFAPPGESPGLLFAERAPGPWGEVDRNYLILSAELIARSPAFAPHLNGPAGLDREAERLADAAAVAGRVAHDFAGILTGVCGYSDLAGQLLSPDSRPGELVAGISSVARRGMVLTKRVREFAAAGDAKPTPGSVPDAARREAARLGVPTSHWPNFPADLPAVAMDAGPLGVVIGHLLANAIEAVPASAPVTLSARLVEISAADAKSYRGAARAGAAVEVVVRDHGPGVKPGTPVGPFLTTKHRHPGLGLATVTRALAAHHGGVRLEPAGPGTAARFVAPVAAVGSRPLPSPARPVPHYAQG